MSPRPSLDCGDVERKGLTLSVAWNVLFRGLLSEKGPAFEWSTMLLVKEIVEEVEEVRDRESEGAAETVGLADVGATEDGCRGSKFINISQSKKTQEK